MCILILGTKIKSLKYLEGISNDNNSTALSEDSSNNSSFELVFEFELGQVLEPHATI